MIDKRIPLVEKLLKSYYPQIKFNVKCEGNEVHVYIPYTSTTIYNPNTFEPIAVLIKDGNGEKIMIKDFTDWEVYEPFNNFLPNIKLEIKSKASRCFIFLFLLIANQMQKNHRYLLELMQ